MRLGAGFAAFALSLALARPGAAAAGEETITEYVVGDSVYVPQGVGETEPFHSWFAKLRGPLAGRSTAAAAAALSPGSGLADARMRELVDLWRAAARASNRDEDRPADRAARQRRFVALLASTGRAPLVLQAAAAAEGITLDCRKDSFAAYLAGSVHREAEGWTLVRAADCSEWLRNYIAVAPAKAALPLLLLAYGGEIPDPIEPVVLAALTSEQGLARFQTDDPEALRARIGAYYLRALFDAGQVEDAIAYYESLPAVARGRLFALTPDPLEVRSAGLTAPLAGDDSKGDIETSMIAVFALAGRTQDAERLFGQAKGPERLRALRACAERGMASKGSPECQDDRREHEHDNVLQLIDHILHGGDSDPYPLAEMLAGGLSVGHAGLMTALRCRVFREAAYASLCEEGRSDAYEAEEDDAANGAAAMAGLPALGASADSVGAIERRLSAATSAQPAPSSRARRASLDPLPSPFEERPLPAGLAGSGKAAPKGLAPLPDGYALIRAETSGSRAVAISASQNYDPTGEVSMGGYWVHLSEDGGRHWQRPLYTGFADRFPYVVVGRSPLPLLDGDTINLAVEVNLIDTATISYPPVGIRSREKRSGLYLRIPIEALRKDSDEDGLSDIAARHLLLDPESMAGGTPVRLDGNGVACTREEMAAQEPLRLLLERVFGSDTGAIMEPLDRKPGEIMAGRRIDVASFDRPMLIKGDPADFRCLRSRRLAVVYGAKDIERLQRMSPDFHPAEVRHILFNRARDRGYASWSTGWAGGTLRFRKTAAGWVSEPISSWIT